MHVNFKMRMEQISCCLAIKSELRMEDFTGIKSLEEHVFSLVSVIQDVV